MSLPVVAAVTLTNLVQGDHLCFIVKCQSHPGSTLSPILENIKNHFCFHSAKSKILGSLDICGIVLVESDL